MIDRLILAAAMGVTGWNGLNPEPPVPMSLQAKAKYKSVSAVCAKKKKTLKVKELCKKWEEHNA
jgi:hypothetical protein